MSFRFSRGNIVGWAGLVLLALAASSLLRRLVGGAVGTDTADDEFDVNRWLQSLPWWVFALVILVGLVLTYCGGVIQGRSRSTHDAAFDDYAKDHGWTLFPAPRWVWESATWPLDGSKSLDAGVAFVGGFDGHWATVLMVQNEGGPRGTEARGTYQIIGLPFDDDMPRVHVMPRDVVEQTREMSGGERIDFESAAFNAQWRVRGEDAKRVHDIIHPRTMERLLRPDAVGQPIIIDGGAIWTWRANPVYGAGFEEVLGVLRDVATAIPAFLYQDLNVRLLAKRTNDLHADWVTSRREAGIAQRDQHDTVDEG